MTTEETGATDVTQIDESKKENLRTIMQDMNSITHSVEELEREVVVEDEEGKETISLVTETILNINIYHTPCKEMLEKYYFTKGQKEQVEVMLSENNATLWEEVLGYR